MSESTIEELLRLNQRLLDCIAQADWAVYQELCDPLLTAFEPESLGQLVEGLEFHRFYFQLEGVKGSHNTTMCSPRARLMGDVAVISYVRLSQRVASDGSPITSGFAETRVWQRRN